MKTHRLLILSSLLLLAVACNGGSGGSGGSGGGASNGTQPQPSQPVKSCDVVFKKSDTMAESAVKGDKARNECGLSEEEIERLIDAAK
jgi:hypothetical protein